MINRRNVALAAAATVLLPVSVGARASRTDPVARLRAIEQAAGGRLGAFVLDTDTGRSFGWRADERFCHCSTFKFSLAAMSLRESDAGRIDSAETLPFSRADLVDYAPVIEANLARGGLPMIMLAEAVQVTSDNAAANILMRRLGGPKVLTQFWRETGDTVSRLDGYEPEINIIPPGTQENSTTPKAMAETMHRIVFGDVLKPESRNRLCGWMEATQSGMRRVRAGMPAGWRGLDKTGTGMRPGVGNKTNDLAILIPPAGRAPLIVTGYFENPVFSENARQEDEAVLKTLGELAVSSIP